jgi:hypothetical protein
MSVWQAVGSAVGGLLGMGGQASANRANAREARRNRNFQREMRNSEIQARVTDAEKAGINPIYALGASGASSPPGSTPASMQDVTSSAREGMRAALELKTLRAQATQAEAQANVAKVQEWFEQTRKQFWSGKLRVPIGGRMIEIGGGSGHAYHHLGMQQMMAELAQTRARSGLTGNAEEVSNLLMRLAGPGGRLLDTSARGWNRIMNDLPQWLREMWRGPGPSNRNGNE